MGYRFVYVQEQRTIYKRKRKTMLDAQLNPGLQVAVRQQGCPSATGPSSPTARFRSRRRERESGGEKKTSVLKRG